MHLLSVKLSLNCSVLFFKNQFLRNVSQSLINNIIKKEGSFTKKKNHDPRRFDNGQKRIFL